MKSKTAHLTPHTDFLWSRRDYEDLAELGVFGPEDRLELLNGRLITMAPQKAPHAVSYTLARDYLDRVFSSGHHIRAQLPLVLDDHSEPEPDLAVVRGNVRDYLQGHPTSADTVLVVEVADSSLHYDRTEKLRAYAAAGIPEYWILNLVDRVVECHRDPTGDRYAQTKVLDAGEFVSPRGHETHRVSVTELLP